MGKVGMEEGPSSSVFYLERIHHAISMLHVSLLILTMTLRIGVFYPFYRLQNRGTYFPKSHKEQKAI